MKAWQYDLYRLTGETSFKVFLRTLWDDKAFRLLTYYRYLHADNTFIRIISRIGWHFCRKKTTIDFNESSKIGPGMLFMHPHTIGFGPIIAGRNLTLLKGASIGTGLSGTLGDIVIGDDVYIGLHATVVGKITIGSRVMICANTFVNFDVPDDCIVLGSPGVIHPKKNASLKYIHHSIDELEGKN